MKELEKLKADLAVKVSELETAEKDNGLVDGLLKHSYDKNSALKF